MAFQYFASKTSKKAEQSTKSAEMLALTNVQRMGNSSSRLATQAVETAAMLLDQQDKFKGPNYLYRMEENIDFIDGTFSEFMIHVMQQIQLSRQYPEVIPYINKSFQDCQQQFEKCLQGERAKVQADDVGDEFSLKKQELIEMMFSHILSRYKALASLNPQLQYNTCLQQFEIWRQNQ